MFLRVTSAVYILCIAGLTLAADPVSMWLQRMGCDKLLASYLEEKLENGSNQEKINAAKDLAILYASILSNNDDGGDTQTLQLATTLLNRMPKAGNDDLRIQLLRATYLAAEQILEKYRLRVTNKSQADLAVEQLREVAEGFQKLRDKLIEKNRKSSRVNDQLGNNIGLTTSLLAWTKYYIAWHTRESSEAKMAESLFAEILLGEKASKAMVSLDLKEKEHGARAILGIALCKDIINGPAPPDDWFDELEDMATWSTVRTMLPMWKFFLEIDNKRWKNVLRDMESVECVDANLILRLAAVHSIENPTEPFAQDVSEKAMAAFISSEQLAMISEIVNLYGIAALPKSGFIEKYILADIAYRKARGEVFGNNPPENIELQSRFRDIAKTFSSALAASDTDQFNSLHDDCSYMEGLSLFYASEFESAVKAFEKSSNTNQSERAVWMAIVCLEKIKVKTSENILQEKQLIEKYLTMWPHTRRSTELLLLQSNEKEADPQFVDDLLAVPYSDPNYERSQREAARQLYKAWRITKHSDKSVVGNKYVSVAIVLMNSDIDNVDDLSIQRAAVRALRLLEISLHRDVKRLVASEQAFEVLNRVRKGGRFDINQYLQELTYRQVIYDLLRGSNQAAISIAMEMISLHPDSPWSTKSAKSIWNTMSEEDSSPKLVYAIGAQVLRNVSDDLIASEQYVDLSKVTAEAGFEYSQAEDDNAVGEDALRIARILIKAYPKSLELLQLNAMIEHSLGEKVASLNHWRAIVTGSVQGSSDWLSAKYEVVKLVATDSPKEALRIIEQLHTIYPNYGGAPYGPMLKELHDDLRGHND